MGKFQRHLRRDELTDGARAVWPSNVIYEPLYLLLVPCPPLLPLIIQATADEAPLVAYCCLQIGANHLRDDSSTRWPAYRCPAHYQISQR
jgi:hypothetical protein